MGMTLGGIERLKKRQNLNRAALGVLLSWAVFVAGAFDCFAQGAAELPTISAATAIVIDQNSGQVIGSKNPDTLRPNPSTTKIMTALIAIERNAANLDVIAGPISAKAADTYGSTMNLEAGDTVSLRDLLYGLMLPSGNDAGVAIAEWIGGTEDAFVLLMNNRAQSLGLNNTSYRNSFGYDPVELPAQCVPPHSSAFNCGAYTTARDLSTLARFALGNPTFARIVQTTTWTPTSWLSAARTPRSLLLVNDNLLLSSMAYLGADGVKTGMSSSAGFCMVASATRGNRSVLTVVMGCPSNALRHLESQTLLDWGFTQLANSPTPTPTPTPTSTPTPTPPPATPPPATPTPSPSSVSISITQSVIGRGDDTVFVISTSRPDATGTTTVRYAMAGTARLGRDYSLSGTLGEANIEPGASSTQVVLHASPGVRGKRAKRATMRLVRSTTYRISPPNQAGVTIRGR
jgi:D-alanyl-D-alanine carboxypeptidase